MQTEDQSFSSHAIVCEDSRFNDLGLFSFTEEDFDDWVSINDNRDLIGISNAYGSSDEDDDAITEAKNAVFDVSSDAETNISYWRKSGRNGYFDTIDKLKKWSYSENGITYRYADLEIDETSIVSQLIQFNDDLSNTLDSDIESLSTKDRARFELLNDIKSSKNGCFSWKKTIDNVITGTEEETNDLGEITSFIPTRENIEFEFKLYLFDIFTQRSNKRKTTLKSFNYVDNKNGAFGDIYLDNDSGSKTSVTDLDDPKQKVAAPISLYYNEYLGEWESGTPNLIAVLSTDIDAAQNPGIDSFESETTQYCLDTETGQEVVYGSAIPIVMQNGNPDQWCPNYAEHGKPENTDKEETRVYNILPISFTRGDYVSLKKINGVWIPFPIGESSLPEVSKSVDRWSFSYLAQTTEGFHRTQGKNFGQVTTYQDYEQAYHKKYYQNDEINSTRYSSADIQDATDAGTNNNFIQITSWDYLGSGIGGNNSKNNIGSTVFGIDPDGTVHEKTGRSSYGQTMFFGVCFPDGYSDEEKVTELSSEKTYDLVTFRDTGSPVFTQNVSSGVNVFQNDNNANGESVKLKDNYLNSSVVIEYGYGGSQYKEGIFRNGSISHLPADIALNSSLNGTYGFPITDMNSIANGELDFTNRYEHVSKDGNKDSSVYDIRPANINKIQFRPLKTELYAQLYNSGDIDIDEDGIDVFEPGVHQQTGSSTLGDRGKVIPESISDRYLNDLIGEGGSGLKYNVYIPDDTRAAQATPYKYWDQAPFTEDRTWVDDTENGKAFGVIGAQATVQANERIKLSTDSFIGMKSFQQNSWASPTSYYAQNTSALFARAYQAWPRELTLFDPRYFVVHHFNPGLDDMLVTKYTENIADSSGAYSPYTNSDHENYDKDISVDFTEPKDPSGTVVTEEIDFIKNTKRRGKLLPYTYNRKSLGVKKIDVIDGGSGFETGDAVSVSSPSGKSFSGSVVALDGVAKSITVLDEGYDFEVSDIGATVFSEEKPTLKAEVSELVVVETPDFTDSKPKIAFTQDLIDLNAPIGQDSEATFTQTSATTFTALGVGGVPFTTSFGGSSSITGSRSINSITEATKEVVLDIANPSNDRKYDLFFRFHNDITHTFFEASTKGREILPIEQKIDLEISIDPNI